jgi:transcription antitermination protein NusB
MNASASESTPGQPAGGKTHRSAPKSARRRSREFALQGLYEWLLSGDTDGQNAGAIEAHMRESLGFAKADEEHFVTLLNGTIRNAVQLRERIVPHLDRSLAELSPIEHGVLLIGTYELMHHVEIPYRVVINEGVELTKSFGGTDGFKYVNGVLDKVAADVRGAEFQAGARR